MPGGPTSAGALAPPGLYDLENGRTQALGVLRRVDLEGGFWAVTNALPGGEPGREEKVIAVLANAAELGLDLESLEGAYVSAVGKLLGGASIRMAGPELQLDTLEKVADTVVVPESPESPSS